MNKIYPLNWYSTLISGSYHQRNWLQDRGSLTRRIQSRCSHFYVKPILQSLQRICGDELSVMGLRSNELAMVREVYLYCNSVPVIFAHSVIARKDLCGSWRGLTKLGNKSLGTILFSNPRIKRTPLEYKRIKPSHLLYGRACAKLPQKPAYLWARRSLFTLHGQSILVTEVFLPTLLDLPL